MKKQAPQKFEFKGLGDWFEVFRAGTHIDSKGVERTWSTADLDSIVANHSSDAAAPFVVGHPKTNNPAFGWVSELKRDGDVLLAKGRDIYKEFADAVEQKLYPKRSVSLVQTDSGIRLNHVGFLGAVAPAVPGLQDIQFNLDASASTYEFSTESAVRSAGWHLGSVGRMMRGIKNWFIEQEGAEKANDLIPEYAIEELASAGRDISSALDDKPESDFSKHSPTKQTDDAGGNAVSEFTKEQLDQAVKDAVAKATAPLNDQITQLNADKDAAAFNARLNDAQTLVNGLLEDGKLVPAMSSGVAEFLANLPDDSEAAFEFSVGDGDQAETKNQSPREFMTGFLKGLPKQIEFNKRRVNADDDTLDMNDSDAIGKAAQEFQQSEEAAGRTISIADAVTHVTKGGAQ